MMGAEINDMNLTSSEIRRIAYNGNNAALYQFIHMFDTGRYTWEQVMQGATLYLSRENEVLRKELLNAIESRPATPILVQKERH
jgi:hypothetical protein